MTSLEQFLKEKWFLVAADALVVVGILSLGLDPSDPLQAVLAVSGILAASAIVVIPVLREEGTRRQRQQEERRLRAALAQELDLLRGEIRAAGEVAARRATDIEMGARKAGEAAAEAVARKASSEIAGLRAELAAASGATEGLEELRAQIQSVADAARGATADAETAIEQAEAAAREIDALRGTFGDARAKADTALKAHQASLGELREALDDLRRQLETSRPNPPEASAPAASVATRDVEPEAVAEAEEQEEAEETEEAEEAEDSDEPGDSEEAGEVEEVEPPAPAAEEAEVAPPARTVMASEDDATGTCLIVNLMIGIGNKPFVRGTGPGLSEEAGEPMQFLAIGRWLWRAPVSDAAVTIQVWKNDKSPLGEPVRIAAGETRELDEDFFAG
jgi:predicted  nucleic acid-binding Zn-ribbon protein